MISFEYILVILSVLLFLSVIASKAASFSGIPSILIFLCIGMLMGSDGPGGLYFDNAGVTQIIGVLSLVFILFSGGIETNWKSVAPILWSGILLSTLGIIITSSFVGAFAYYFFDFTIYEGLLLGTIVSSTDASAVFTTLRSKNAHLKGNLRPLIEFESGSNDPMAVFLTIFLIKLISQSNVNAWQILPTYLQQMSVAAFFGILLGKSLCYLLKKVRLDFFGLYPVLTTAGVLFIYGITQILGGNGFLAIYIAAITLGNEEFASKAAIMSYHDGIAWLMQIVMFVALGLQVYPQQLFSIIFMGMIFSIFLIFIARPAAVFLCLFRSKFDFKEKIIVSWVGLKGAVPIILATYPLLAGIEKAMTIFNLVFFIVLTSTLVQGPFIPYLASKLNLKEN